MLVQHDKNISKIKSALQDLSTAITLIRLALEPIGDQEQMKLLLTKANTAIESINSRKD